MEAQSSEEANVMMDKIRALKGVCIGYTYVSSSCLDDFGILTIETS
jgi:hypothetical protein